MTLKELAKAVVKAQKAMEAAYPRDLSDDEGYKKYGEARDVYDKAVRKLRRADKIEAAKHPVKFITWKRYGFRHIIASELPPEDQKYGNEKYTIIRGMAFCGNDWSELIAEDPQQIWWMNRFDQRGTDRPLCGTCKRYWKNLTGKDAE